MTYWVEHADTFSYEYTVVAECDTRDEANEVAEWYRKQAGAMSEYRVVDTYGALKGTPYPELIAMATARRQAQVQATREPSALRPEDV